MHAESARIVIIGGGIVGCSTAAAVGARGGILTTVVFFWAAFHFYLAAIGLGKLMGETAATPTTEAP